MLRNIEAERVRKGMTKDQIAQALGVSRKTYWNWINERQSIPSSHLIRMAQFFAVSVDYLLSNPDEKAV